jgi:hypothetical protein
MFGMKYFNEIKGSQPMETKLGKEAKKVNSSSNVNVEDLDKPIVFDVVKNNK